jgi:hypothetical protein
MKRVTLRAIIAPSSLSLGLVRPSSIYSATMVDDCCPRTHCVRWASTKGASRRSAAPLAAPPRSSGTAVFPKVAKRKAKATPEDDGVNDDEVGDLDRIVEDSMTEAARATSSTSKPQDDIDEAAIEDEPSDTTVFTTGRDVATEATSDGVAEAEEDEDGAKDELVPSLSDDTAQSKHLVVNFPNISKQYAATNPIPLANVLIDNGAVVTWCCGECTHEWNQAVFLRCILRNPCPHCDAVKNPTLKSHGAASTILKEWDSDRNDPFVDPEALPISSTHKAWWTCTTCRTSFEARVKSRVQGKSLCPTCSVTTLQSSSASNETIQLEWHPVKNGDLRLEQVPPTTKVWWLCSSCGHEWDASVGQRLRLKRTSNCSQCNKKAAQR